MFQDRQEYGAAVVHLISVINLPTMPQKLLFQDKAYMASSQD
jgi:hypothetical protein